MDVRFEINKSGVQSQLLKNNRVEQLLKNKMGGASYTSYQGDRIVVIRKDIKKETVSLSPRERAKYIMRNAKSPQQKRYAKFLFSQLK